MKDLYIINKIIEDGNCDNFSCDGGAYKNVDIPCPLSKNGCNRIIGVDNNAIIKLANRWLIDHLKKSGEIMGIWFPISKFEDFFVNGDKYLFKRMDSDVYTTHCFFKSKINEVLRFIDKKYSWFLIITPPKE